MTARPGPRLTRRQLAEEAELVAKLYLGGVAVPQLAARFGCSTQTIYKRLHRAGIEFDGPKDPVTRIRVSEAGTPLLIGAAKDKLTGRYALTEAEAHRWLQHAAMNHHIPMIGVAQAVIAVADQLEFADLKRVIAKISVQQANATV